MTWAADGDHQPRTRILAPSRRAPPQGLGATSPSPRSTQPLAPLVVTRRPNGTTPRPHDAAGAEVASEPERALTLDARRPAAPGSPSDD